MNCLLISDLRGSLVRGVGVLALLAASCAGDPPGPLHFGRPQEPREPYPYDTDDVVVPNEEAALELACTLAWPKGGGPFDAVVLISGSGAQNRNEELANHRPFLVLSDALARNGIASLRCDDRGFGGSSGDFASATTLDFVADATRQIAFLDHQRHFAVSRIGLIGHSEGGLVGPLAADGDPAVDFLVLLAGPGVTGEEILVSQQRAMAAAAGVPEDELDAADALNRELLALVRTIADLDERDASLRSLLRENGVAGDELDSLVAWLQSPWMRFFVGYDPAPVLRRTRLPVLALNGTLDLQVLADLNLPAIASALEEAGNASATVQAMPGLNHLFQHAETGLLEEYQTLDETMSPDALRTISDWIRRH